ncbi:MAG: glycosyltransferase [Clostridia bacterium]|nr:glycosyltransferase [Clostridia bacterium]
MKILWIVNMVLPGVARELGMKTSASGSWLNYYARQLSLDPDIELATMTYANVSSDIDKTACGMRNFIFAGGGKRLLFDNPKTAKDCQKVLDEFKPDVIHIHGTEYSVGAAMVKLKPKVPVLLTIQGILTRIGEEYYGGLPFSERIKIKSVKSVLGLKTPFFAKYLMLKNAKREREVLKNVRHVTGRTEWDRSVMLSVNDSLTYHRLNYNIRAEFYDAPKWDIEKIDKHTVYTGAATYCLKGLHILLRAIAIVKNKYPDVCLRIPANNGNYRTANAYEKYILRLIKKLGIEENVCFVGRKDALGVVEMLSKSHVCVVPSAMEGASATMCEAMMLGTPGICAYRGGMTDLLRDGESGFFYDFKEYPVLASRIMQLFENEDLCRTFSSRVIVDAEARHDREKNYKQLVEIYEQLLKENENA